MTERLAADTVLETLTRAESLHLLASVEVGRLGYTVHGGARIEVVNFAWDGDGVVFRTAVGAKSIAIARGSHLALEADRLDEATGTGWSVTVAGPAEWIDDPAEVARLTRLLHPWAPGEHPHFVRVHAAHVFGRRIRRTAADDVTSASLRPLHDAASGARAAGGPASKVGAA